MHVLTVKFCNTYVLPPPDNIMHVSWHLATPFCCHIYSITFFFVSILYFVSNFNFTKKYVELRYFFKLRGICSNCLYSNVLLLHVCMPLRSTIFFAHISRSHMSVHFEKWFSVIYRYVYAYVYIYIYIYIYINTHALILLFPQA